MLRLSYGVAIALFIVVECIRSLSVPPFGCEVAKFMQAYLDHRESGRIILSHTYLLLGCALPLWLNPYASTNLLVSNAGVLALGIGDAMV